MKKRLMILLPPLLVVLTVWIAVIIWWRVTNRLPNGVDALLWLLVLPLSLLLGYWLLKKFFDISKRILSPLFFSATANSAAAATNVLAATNAGERLRGQVLHLLGGSVCLPHADNLGALFEKLDEPQFAPSIDAQLQDEHGKPLLVTAVAGLDTAATQSALQQFNGQNSQLQLTPRLLRSVAMADQVLEQTLSQLEQWSTLPLQIICVLPLTWSEQQRSLVAVWLRRQVLERGWSTEKLSVSIITTQAEAEVVITLDRYNELFNQQQHDQIGMLLAVDSALDKHVIANQPADWFTAHRAKGVVPGEGAAAILFMRADCELQSLPEADTITVLHRAASGRRDKPASAAGHINGELVKELSRQAMHAAQLSITDFGRAVTDVDHRGSRVQEVASLMPALQAPDAQPISMSRVGASMGFAGVAASIAALLAAHHSAINEHKPVLMLSALGDFERAAVVVKPLSAADLSA